MAVPAESLGNAPSIGASRDEEQPACSAPPDTDKRPSTAASSSPIHPISQLQGPFEESLTEATDASTSEWVVELDAQTRRRDLLENDEYERLCGRKWRQRESEK